MAVIRSDNDLTTFPGFPEGMNTVDDAAAIGPRALREALNVDLHSGGKPRRRRGRRKVLGGSNVHSLFAHPDFPFALVRSTDQLLAFDGTFEPIVIADGLGGQPASYAELNGDLLWTVENVATGRLSPGLENRPLGVPTPPGVPQAAAAANGGLFAGAYKVALSYQLASGEEGGACAPRSVVVGDNGAIVVTLPDPEDARVEAIRVWISEPGDGVLYHAIDVVAGMPEVLIGEGPRGKDAEARHLFPLPPGHLLRVLNGIPWMATGNQVYHCEAMRPGLHHPGHHRFPFQKRIDMMQPVGQAESAGMYIASGQRTFWLAGATPKQTNQRIARSTGAVPGTGLTVPGEVFGQAAGDVAYWMASDGVPCLGLPGGQVVPLNKQVARERFERGASLLREIAGVVQVVTAGRGGTRSSFGAADTVEVKQYRNGIEVP